MALRRDPENIETKQLHDYIGFAGARVVEIGSGDGRMTWRFANSADYVVGVEPDPTRISDQMRTIPYDYLGQVSFVRATAENLPFPDQSFDHALFAWSL